MPNYSIERLGNGFYLVRDRRSGLQGVWNADGTRRHGDLTRTISARQVDQMVRERIAATA